MKVLVTGGTGSVGQGVVKWLVNHGHDVRVVDLKTGTHRVTGAEYVECDITRFDDLRTQVRGMDGIAHLAAYPDPNKASGTEIFRVNCWGTFNVYEAAAAEGIHRVASASSINAMGYNFGVKSYPIQYFPCDEDHPRCTTDPYSFSKETLESIAAYYWRRDGITSACLRMPFVFAWDELMDWVKPVVSAYHQALLELLSLPDDVQQKWLGKIHAGIASARASRAFEKPWGDVPPTGFAFDQIFTLGFGITDFWSAIAVEDAAQAFEKSLLANFEGSHPLFISQRENMFGVESEKLLRVFYPEVTARKRPIMGAGTLLSYDRAAELFGYEPKMLVSERMA